MPKAEDVRVLFYDTETTGLPLHPDAPLDLQPRVIEFAGILVSARTGEELATEEQLINPGRPLPAEITKITGLTDADLVGAPPMAEYWPRLQEFILRADVISAHNLPFDRSMLQFEARRLGVELGWPKKAVCTLATFRPIWGRAPKLTELYEHFVGRELAQTHRALDDVRALVAAATAGGLLKRLAP